MVRPERLLTCLRSTKTIGNPRKDCHLWSLHHRPADRIFVVSTSAGRSPYDYLQSPIGLVRFCRLWLGVKLLIFPQLSTPSPFYVAVNNARIGVIMDNYYEKWHRSFCPRSSWLQLRLEFLDFLWTSLKCWSLTVMIRDAMETKGDSSTIRSRWMSPQIQVSTL